MNPIDTDRFSADHFAREGARAFALAALGQDVLYNTVIGLRCVLQLSNHDGVVGLSELSVKLLMDASRGAVPAIAEHVEETLSAERAYFGMGAAAGLIALFGKPPEHVTAVETFPLVMDRIDHVALLAAELDILSRRHSIEARGDVLRRAVQVRQFLALDITDDIRLN
jgi:hypothetical protein